MILSPIQFALVAAPRPGRPASEWTEFARRAEADGWSSLLVPDTLATISPFPALAAAAAVTTTLRLRTWVLAVPMRTPGAVARESSALQQLSDGRFELGLGAGRPDAEAEAGRLGVRWGTAGERVRQIADVAAAVREQVNPVPLVVVAARGARSLAAAARTADRVAIASQPTATSRHLDEAAGLVQAAAQGRAVALSLHAGIGDRVPWFLARHGVDAAVLATVDAVALLRGDRSEMADQLRRLRQRHHINEIVVPGELAADVQPLQDFLRT